MIPASHGEPSRGLVLDFRLWRAKNGNRVWVGSPVEGFLYLLKEDPKEKLWKWVLLLGFDRGEKKEIQRLRVVTRTDTMERVLVGHREGGWMVVQSNPKRVRELMVYKANVLPWPWQNVLEEKE